MGETRRTGPWKVQTGEKYVRTRNIENNHDVVQGPSRVMFNRHENDDYLITLTKYNSLTFISNPTPAHLCVSG